MIEVKNLTKRYGENRALNDVSFSIKKGEIVGFLGPNGAGKTTTMNILTGYLSATSGQVNIGGFDILEEPIKAKQKIGYLPEQPPLYLDMLVKEYLGFVFDLKKVELPKKAHLDDVCELVRIQDVQNRLIKNLSKGYRQRVGFAAALLGNPEVLILDEPTVGLDPRQIIEIRNLIGKLGRSHTVVLSSHILSEIQAVCDRILVINRGYLVADNTPDKLAQSASADRRLVARIQGPHDEVLRVLETLPRIVSVADLGKKESSAYDYAIEAEPNADVRVELFDRLSSRNWPLLGLRGSEMSLEDVFLQLISTDPSEMQGAAPGGAPQETPGEEVLEAADLEAYLPEREDSDETNG